MRVWRWLVVVVGVGWVGLVAVTSRSQLARAVVWGESDTGTIGGSRPGWWGPGRTGSTCAARLVGRPRP
jgi:hypothetical protein